MPERIYVRNDQGGLEPMEEQPYDSEDALQALLAQHPELLDGEQVRPDNPRRWLLISREMGVAERPDEGSRWSLDHLLVDQDATPTLVECKLSANTEIRRTIVGQMLDYAAHAWATWTAEVMQAAFERSCEQQGSNPSAALERLLGSDGAADADSFWQQVATNLRARRMRLLFVADDIPDPLRRVVEFLNQQMPDVEVLAVAIKQFKAREADRSTLVPQVLGRLEKTGPKPTPTRLNYTRETFLAAFADETDRKVAQELLKTAEQPGANIQWGSASVGIRARCPQYGANPITVALLTPPGRIGGWPGEGLTNLYLGEAAGRWIPDGQANIKAVLDAYVDSLEECVFLTRDDRTSGRRGYTATYADAAPPHLDAIGERLADVVEALGALE